MVDGDQQQTSSSPTGEQILESCYEFEQLCKLLNERVKNGSDPGGSACCVVRPTEKGAQKVFDHVTGDMKADSICRLFSMTKPLTAAALLILLGRKALELDDPVSNFIPGFGKIAVQRRPPGGIGWQRKTELRNAVVRSQQVRRVGDADREQLQGLSPQEVDIVRFYCEEQGCDFVETEPGYGSIARKKDATPKPLVDPLARPMTVKMLLTHRSGLGYGPICRYEDPQTEVHRLYNRLAWDIEQKKVTSLEDWADRLAEIPLLSQPGDRTEYGYGLDVIGRIIEVVSGQSLPDFIKKEILDPLDMVDTSFAVPSEKANRLAELHWRQGKGEGKGQPAGGCLQGEESVIASGGGGVEPGKGGMVSTFSDFMKFCTMLLCKGQLPNGDQLIPLELIEDAARGDPAMVEGASGYWLLGYSFRGDGTKLMRMYFSGMANTAACVDFERRYMYVFFSQTLEGGRSAKPPSDEIERFICNAWGLEVPRQRSSNNNSGWNNNNHVSSTWGKGGGGGKGGYNNGRNWGGNNGRWSNGNWSGGYKNWKADGNSADISEEGYLSVAQLRDTAQMRIFVTRVAGALGLTVVNPGDLWGFAPFYSGEKMTQSLSRMIEELLSAPWLRAIEEEDE